MSCLSSFGRSSCRIAVFCQSNGIHTYGIACGVLFMEKDGEAISRKAFFKYALERMAAALRWGCMSAYTQIGWDSLMQI